MPPDSHTEIRQQSANNPATNCQQIREASRDRVNDQMVPDSLKLASTPNNPKALTTAVVVALMMVAVAVGKAVSAKNKAMRELEQNQEQR